MYRYWALCTPNIDVNISPCLINCVYASWKASLYFWRLAIAKLNRIRAIRLSSVSLTRLRSRFRPYSLSKFALPPDTLSKCQCKKENTRCSRFRGKLSKICLDIRRRFSQRAISFPRFLLFFVSAQEERKIWICYE